MMKPQLFGLKYSPWTEKARWALDHYQIDYDYIEHIPIFMNPLIRLRTLNFTGKLTVPVLADHLETYRNSFEIARHADRAGSNSTLFPKTKGLDIESWDNHSNDALNSARILVTLKTANDSTARKEAIAPMVPEPFLDIMEPLADAGIMYFKVKYDIAEGDATEARDNLRDVLLLLRESLKNDYLLNEFSYADIAMSVVLQAVKPLSTSYLDVGPGTRRAWSEPELADEFSDLVEWRDMIYRKHRSK